MKPETLTELERLQLVNQYTILEKLDEENTDHWAECKRIVREGYTIFYSKVFDPIWEELSYEDCRYVMEVLDLHDALQQSFFKLAEKDGISESDVAFHGFSGNDESHLLCFAGYLRDTGKWQTLLKDKKDLDSHFPTTWRYRAMLEKWSAIGSIDVRHRLSKEQIKDILDEPGKKARKE